MAKPRERNELEVLRAENRKLSKEIKDLKKQLSRTKKRAHQYHDLEERQAEKQIADEFASQVVLDRTVCTKCGGKMDVIDLNVRIMYLCESCGSRQVVKKNG